MSCYPLPVKSAHAGKPPILYRPSIDDRSLTPTGRQDGRPHPARAATTARVLRGHDFLRPARSRAWRNRRRRLVQLLDGEASCRLVAGHELRALLRRNHIVDVVEGAAAPFIHYVEQAERTGTAIAQDHLGDRATQ